MQSPDSTTELPPIREAAIRDYYASAFAKAMPYHTYDDETAAVGELLAEVKRLREANQALETRRAYGSDIINDMTAEACQLGEQMQAALAGWQNMRVIAAGLRRNAGYALDQWEGEDRLLEEEQQLEVKKLLQEIVDTTWPIPGVTPEQPAALVYPEELSPELDQVLGWPNFKCGAYARAFREAGFVIPEKAEREQAFVLHWLTKFVLRYGADWVEPAQQELRRLGEKVKQERGEGK